MDKKASGYNKPDISIAIRTLLMGGFLLEDAQRKPGYTILLMSRHDEFGASNRYCFALSEQQLNSPQIEAAKIAANHHSAQLVLIDSKSDDVPTVEWSRFINLFGGPVYSSSPLEPDFADQLITLGHNQLPNGINGKPDDLFEIYVRVSLEFVLGGKVLRYGQERRFEARPDGIALPFHGFLALYDTKAYSDGYIVDLDSIRQFKSYIDDFFLRYKDYLPRLNSFIVISGFFPHKKTTLERRSHDLLADCGVPLSFLNAKSLAVIIKMISQHPTCRHAINWSRIFADAIVNPSHVNDEIEAIIRDGIVKA
ncbi:MAG: hypothetical protein JXA42_13670 [Anaerolineales bacterium]|nr:hypothetical protein [Anaerolineales bacterium]